MNDKISQDMERLECVLTSCTVNWKRGNDPDCYQDFIRTLDQLEMVVELYFDCLQERGSKLFSITKSMEQNVRNQDVVGLIDTLEYELIPFIREWRQNNEEESSVLR
jgi:Zn-dependent M32 family carboxypeptidase